MGCAESVIDCRIGFMLFLFCRIDFEIHALGFTSGVFVLYPSKNAELSPEGIKRRCETIVVDARWNFNRPKALSHPRDEHAGAVAVSGSVNRLSRPILLSERRKVVGAGPTGPTGPLMALCHEKPRLTS